jgi:uncharacterized protein YlbG (UPF0298 family)
MADAVEVKVLEDGNERQGLIVWVNDAKNAKQLERFGILHYTSRKMNYAVIYCNADRTDDTIRQIQKLGFVRKVELSHRNDIWKRFKNFGTATTLTDMITPYEAVAHSQIEEKSEVPQE